MALTPLTGVSVPQLVASLRETETDLINVLSAGGSAIDLLNGYQVWADNAVRRLSLLVRPADLRRLVTTSRYWAIQAIDPATRSGLALAGFIGVEIDERRRELEGVQRSLEAEASRWDARRDLLIIADTNVYLHHERRFDELPWVNLFPSHDAGLHIIVPLLIVDELDRRKRSATAEKVSATSSESLRTRARVTLKRFDDLFSNPGAMVILQGHDGASSSRVSIELLLDEPQHVRLPDPDSELVDRALSIRHVSGRGVTLVTFDTGMRIRARAAGLDVTRPAEAGVD
jgi:hypothetical protein